MSIVLCCAGYIAECCTEIHTACHQVEASSKTVAAQRFFLLLKSEGKDCDKVPVVIKLSDKLPGSVLNIVVVKGKGNQRYACLDVEAKIGVEKGLLDHAGKDYYTFAESDPDWNTLLETIRG